MQKYNIQIQDAFAPFLISHIEASSTATVTRCPRVIDNLELTADQLHCKVHLTAFEQLQTRLIHNDSCFVIFRLKNGIVVGVEPRERVAKPRSTRLPAVRRR